MYDDFLKSNPALDKIALSTYFKCNPFYVSPANCREMESCSCIKCLNSHIHHSLRNNIAGMPHLLTDYLTQSFKCP